MRTIILLCIVAFAIATPIDDKTLKSSTNPDISKLPLKKDDVKIKPIASDASIPAHPLHKRESPPFKSQLSTVAPSTGVKNSPDQQPQQPLLNHERRPSVPAPSDPSVPRPAASQPILSQSSRVRRDTPKVSQPAQVQGQKSPSTPLNNQKQGQPLNTQQKTQAPQPPRVNRDAPKPVNSKTPQQLALEQKQQLPNPSKTQPAVAPAQASRNRRDTQKVSAAQPAQLNDQKAQSAPVDNHKHGQPLNTQQKTQTPQAARVSRDAPKPVDSKTPQQPTSGQKQQLPTPAKAQPVASPSQSSRNRRDTPKVSASQPAQVNDQKAQSAPVDNHKHGQPLNTQQKTQTPQAARVNRDTPKPVDSKTPQQPASGQKQQSPTPAKAQPAASPAQGSRNRRDTPKTSAAQPAQVQGQKSSSTPVNNQKQGQPLNTQQKTQTPQAARVNRDTPKPVDSKTPQQPASGQKQQLPTPAKAQPAASPAQGSRNRRDAPNPHEQSKIVPSSYQPAQKPFDTNPSVAAKSAQSSSTTTANPHKRESTNQNSRDGIPSSSFSSSDNQSPSFVHPVPVDQILKKPADSRPSSSVGVTKTESVKIEPSLPTTETKPVSFSDQKPHGH